MGLGVGTVLPLFLPPGDCIPLELPYIPSPPVSVTSHEHDLCFPVGVWLMERWRPGAGERTCTGGQKAPFLILAGLPAVHSLVDERVAELLCPLSPLGLAGGAHSGPPLGIPPTWDKESGGTKETCQHGHTDVLPDHTVIPRSWPSCPNGHMHSRHRPLPQVCTPGPTEE